jgi:hypothetical protein
LQGLPLFCHYVILLTGVNSWPLLYCDYHVG